MLVAPAVKISADTESLMSIASVNGDMKLLSSHIPSIFLLLFRTNFLGSKKNRGISGNRGSFENSPISTGNLMKKGGKKEK